MTIQPQIDRILLHLKTSVIEKPFIKMLTEMVIEIQQLVLTHVLMLQGMLITDLTVLIMIMN